MNETERVARLNATEETYIETIDALMQKLGLRCHRIAKELCVKAPASYYA